MKGCSVDVAEQVTGGVGVEGAGRGIGLDGAALDQIDRILAGEELVPPGVGVESGDDRQALVVGGGGDYAPPTGPGAARPGLRQECEHSRVAVEIQARPLHGPSEMVEGRGVLATPDRLAGGVVRQARRAGAAGSLALSVKPGPAREFNALAGVGGADGERRGHTFAAELQQSAICCSSAAVSSYPIEAVVGVHQAGLSLSLIDRRAPLMCLFVQEGFMKRYASPRQA